MTKLTDCKFVVAEKSFFYNIKIIRNCSVAFFLINLDGKAAAPAQSPSTSRGIAPMFRIGKTQN